ncbi:MAG TPA: hypothetical protein VJT72_14625 [Pseudonocardiaceae bacterium]|nr:hypothetical protein [Pseudonocardiaceae bacterium]
MSVAIDRELLAERAAAVDRHLRRVAEHLPHHPGDERARRSPGVPGGAARPHRLRSAFVRFIGLGLSGIAVLLLLRSIGRWARALG